MFYYEPWQSAFSQNEIPFAKPQGPACDKTGGLRFIGCSKKTAKPRERLGCMGLQWFLETFRLVEAAGIEPASASDLQIVLHT